VNRVLLGLVLSSISRGSRHAANRADQRSMGPTPLLVGDWDTPGQPTPGVSSGHFTMKEDYGERSH